MKIEVLCQQPLLEIASCACHTDRQIMLHFIEPRMSNGLVAFLKLVYPLYAIAMYRKLEIRLQPEVKETFKRLRPETVIICPNHSSLQDPDVLFGIARLVGENFYFLTARELFGSNDSQRQKFLQKVGCFSIERGEPDMQAVRAVHKLLLSLKKKLVIFPEGEVSHQNDYLMSLGNGAERIALNALREAQKRNPQHKIYILPLSLKYSYSKDQTRFISALINKLERELKIENKKNVSSDKRINQCFYKLICVDPDSTDLDSALFLFREKAINDAALFLGIELSGDLDQLSKLHLLRNKLAELRWGAGGDHVTKETRHHFHQLKLSTELIGVGNHTFDHKLTQEEAAELLNVLEFELCKGQSLPFPDIVKIGAAPEIEVNKYFNLFEKDKEKAVSSLRHKLTDSLNECHRSL